MNDQDFENFEIDMVVDEKDVVLLELYVCRYCFEAGGDFEMKYDPYIIKDHIKLFHPEKLVPDPYQTAWVAQELAKRKEQTQSEQEALDVG